MLEMALENVDRKEIKRYIDKMKNEETITIERRKWVIKEISGEKITCIPYREFKKKSIKRT